MQMSKINPQKELIIRTEYNKFGANLLRRNLCDKLNAIKIYLSVKVVKTSIVFINANAHCFHILFAKVSVD